MTQKLILTTAPQAIGTGGAVTAQSFGGSFCYAFGAAAPTDLSACYEDTHVHHSGVHGKIWVWKNTYTTVTLKYDAL